MLDKVKEGVLFMKTHELEKELGISNVDPMSRTINKKVLKFE